MASRLRCPVCGSDELGVNVLVVECRDIFAPTLVHARWDTGSYDSPKYTCICGQDFNERDAAHGPEERT